MHIKNKAELQVWQSNIVMLSILYSLFIKNFDTYILSWFCKLLMVCNQQFGKKKTVLEVVEINLNLFIEKLLIWMRIFVFVRISSILQ